jgi:hypothetical protein
MHILAEAFGFFHWVGISHYINLLFVGFLIRSGLQILSAPTISCHWGWNVGDPSGNGDNFLYWTN